MFYGVCATVGKEQNGYMVIRQLPTFCLDSVVQGIVSKDHAKKIALDIINPLNDPTLIVDIIVVDRH